MLIKCSRCGFINKGDANFCMNCGSNLHEEDNNSDIPQNHGEENTFNPQNDLEWFLEKISNNELNLPTDDCPVILKRGEEPVVVLPGIAFKEPRSVRTSYGGYGGPTIRVTKGVSFRLGGVSHRSASHDEITTIDRGTLTITNKRLIFTGSQRTLNYNLNKILSITEYKDAVAIQKENKQKIEIFADCDNLRLDYELEGKTRSILFYGCLLKAAILSQIQ